MSRLIVLWGLTAILTVAWVLSVQAGAPLETETARFAPRGTFEAEGVFEYQSSRDGRESAFPMAVEYTLADHLALLAEPVPYTNIRPAGTRGARGIGDIEVTLRGQVHAESRRGPALALGAEVKIPTGEAPLIGSDHYDETGYLIASKQLGPVDVHANLGYTVVGHPSGLAVHNTFDYALAGEWVFRPRLALVAEVIGNTAALPEASVSESAVAPEISGGETVGMLGARWTWTPHLVSSFGVTVDNNGAILVRPGLTTRF